MNGNDINHTTGNKTNHQQRLIKHSTMNPNTPSNTACIINFRQIGDSVELPTKCRQHSSYENETFGASFCSGLSITNNSAAVKLNIPAMRLLGNTSRSVL